MSDEEEGQAVGAGSCQYQLAKAALGATERQARVRLAKEQRAAVAVAAVCSWGQALHRGKARQRQAKEATCVCSQVVLLGNRCKARELP